jgi:RNA:NAD 2'-phosphotransferase (TPT1/KptA family)
MPKGRRVEKRGNAIHKFNVQRKFRIGTRKAGRAAHSMTTEALKEILEKADQKRYHQKARTVLAMRGVTV